MVDWQPIETAPKDGSKFAATNGRLCYTTLMMKYYLKWPHEEGGPTYEEKLTGEDSSSLFPWNPTHWMPLPEMTK